MKNIESYIFEKILINKDTKIDLEDPKVNINNIKYELKEPTQNQEDYISIMGADKHFWNTTDPVYVKVKDLGQYTDKKGLMTVAYKICKSINSKITFAEIGTWSDEDKSYVTFAIAHIQQKNQMWHPEWIKSDKYNFI